MASDPLFTILLEDFDRDELDLLVEQFCMGGLARITGGGAYPSVVLDVLRHASRHGWRDSLIAAVRDARPRDPRVLDLAGEVLETPYRTGSGKLEEIVAVHVPRLDPLQWLAQGQEVSVKICAIKCEISNREEKLGSGCLVGPDLVLTANHLIQSIDDPSRIRVRFDYTRARDGSEVRPGIAYGLAARGWRVASRPASPLDEKPKPPAVPRAEELDFAVLRLEAPAGEHSVGAANELQNVPRRDWVRFPAKAVAYPKDSPLLIYHHPEGESMKLSIEMQSVLRLNDNGTRLLHRTNTLGGSSGAPCFDASWDLIGIHQSAQSGYNQAVPIGPIAEALRRDGVRVGAP